MTANTDRYAKSLVRHESNRDATSTVGRNQHEYWGNEANKTGRQAVEEGDADLVGDLTEEQGLKVRLREARASGQDRPELKARLKVFRDRRR